MTRTRRVGVIGSIVWDVIYGRDARSVPIEEWGGIAYALGGLDAALSEDWEIVPIIKVGDDLAPAAARFLSTLRRLAPDGRRHQAGARRREARCSLRQLPERLGARPRDGDAPPPAFRRPDLLRPPHARLGGAARRPSYAAAQASMRSEEHTS